MTGSLAPRPNPQPEIRYQPSLLSLPSAAATVAPEQQADRAARRRRGARRRLWFFTALAVVAGVAAARVLGSERTSTQVQSGSPGYRKAKSGQNLHWHQKALTVYLDPSLAKLGPQANDAVMQAFGRWVESDQRLPDLSFEGGKTSAAPSNDGKSTVSYARITASGHERDLAITVTYAEEHSGEIIEADIVLNSLYPIAALTPKATQSEGRDESHDRNDHAGSKATTEEADDCQNRYDLQNVTTHEAGHFFGLGEDPIERRAAMFQTIDQCEVHKRSLSTTDTGALSALYAEREDPEEAAAGPRACSFGAARYGAGVGWSSVVVLGLGLSRRRGR